MAGEVRAAPWPRKPVSIAAELNPTRSRPEMADDQLVDFVPMASVAVELGGIDLDRARPAHEVRKRYTQFQEGDVLFAKITPCMENGKIAVVPPLRSNVGYGSTEFHVLRPRPDVHPKWLAHFLAQADFRKKARRSMSGSAGQLRVPGKWLDEQEMPLPTLDIQKQVLGKIEEFFSDLDAGVATLERARAKLKRYRASVLKAAVEGRLTERWRAEQKAKSAAVEPAAKLLERILAERRKKWEAAQLKKFADAGKTPPKDWQKKYSEPSVPDVSNLPDLPAEWRWGTVDQLAEIQSGIQKQPSRTPKENAYPYLRVANVHRGRLDLAEIHKLELRPGELDRLKLENGDLLIVEGNGSPSEIGRSAIWEGQIENCVHQNHIIRVRPMLASSSYINTYWNSPDGTARVKQKAASTSGLYTLSVSKIAALPVPLPPLDEQKEIIMRVDAATSIITHAESEIEHSLARAARLRQAILKRAFEGRLV